MNGKTSLVLYHTEHCHLCEQAAALCAAVLNPDFFEVSLVDIADSDVLIERYGVRIPVLLHEASTRELGWPFDVDQLIAFLS
jgi:hypothetical protein